METQNELKTKPHVRPDYNAIYNDKKYTDKYGPKTIFFMQCGSFFEVYSYKNKSGNFINSKITDFSNICEMTIAKKTRII